MIVINDCVALLENRTNWKFIFPWRKINCHVLQILNIRLRCTIWFMIPEKYITRCTRISTSFSPSKLPSLVIDMNTYILYTYIIYTYMYYSYILSKHFWKKIVELLWTVVTYLLKTCYTWNWEWCWYDMIKHEWWVTS